MFDQIHKILPESSKGIARVEHFTISEQESRFSSLRGAGAYVEAGKYVRLMLGNRVIMSNTRNERRSGSF